MTGDRSRRQLSLATRRELIQAIAERYHAAARPEKLIAYIQRNAPLLERDPVLFWKALSLLLALVIVVMLTVGH